MVTNQNKYLPVTNSMQGGIPHQHCSYSLGDHAHDSVLHIHNNHVNNSPLHGLHICCLLLCLCLHSYLQSPPNTLIPPVTTTTPPHHHWLHHWLPLQPVPPQFFPEGGNCQAPPPPKRYGGYFPLWCVISCGKGISTRLLLKNKKLVYTISST